jgi:LPPG:FO 2-phospho-L-lactate transferase
MILALAGGVGGARLASGLAAALAPGELTVAVNVGDDFEHLGLHVAPDIDTVMYTLAGLHNPGLGWGRADETWNFMAALAQLGGETWFRLGDRGLAVHVERTRRLHAGESLSQVTRDLCARLGVRHCVVPVTDNRLRTLVQTAAGELDFQHYFVRLRCEPVVIGFRFDGADTAELSAPLVALMDNASIEGVLLCPSNPWLSIAPMLAVPALRRFLHSGRLPVVAVCPIVGGAAVKGPAAKIMGELGLESSALGVVRHYGEWVDGWVIDRADAAIEDAVTAAGHSVTIMDTIMSSPDRSREVAEAALGLVRRMGSGR